MTIRTSPSIDSFDFITAVRQTCIDFGKKRQLFQAKGGDGNRAINKPGILYIYAS